MSTISLYAVGGGGINVAKSIKFPPAGQAEAGFADINVHYVDTSKSNLAGIDPAKAFLIQEDADRNKVDGSGKVRATNAEPILAAVPEILYQHKPGDVNILLHSASGGSGSVCGPALVDALLEQDKTVIVILIGSTTCEREVKNTTDTLLTYEHIAHETGKPVVAFYHENGLGASMQENDNRIRVEILLAMILWSGQNHGLDSQDLTNFINYHKTSAHFPVGLTGLKVFTHEEPLKLERGQAASSILTLTKEGEDPTPGVITAYHSYGVISAAAEGALRTPTPLHLATIQGYFAPIVHRLQDTLKEMHAHFSGAPVASVSLKGVQPSKGKLIL